MPTVAGEFLAAPIGRLPPRRWQNNCARVQSQERKASPCRKKRKRLASLSSRKADESAKTRARAWTCPCRPRRLERECDLFPNRLQPSNRETSQFHLAGRRSSTNRARPAPATGSAPWLRR